MLGPGQRGLATDLQLVPSAERGRGPPVCGSRGLWGGGVLSGGGGRSCRLRAGKHLQALRGPGRWPGTEPGPHTSGRSCPQVLPPGWSAPSACELPGPGRALRGTPSSWAGPGPLGLWPCLIAHVPHPRPQGPALGCPHHTHGGVVGGVGALLGPPALRVNLEGTRGLTGPPPHPTHAGGSETDSLLLNGVGFSPRAAVGLLGRGWRLRGPCLSAFCGAAVGPEAGTTPLFVCYCPGGARPPQKQRPGGLTWPRVTTTTLWSQAGSGCLLPP